MQDNPTLEVLAVVTAVDKISEPAALSAVLFLSIPDFVCFQRQPTPIGDSLGSYAWAWGDLHFALPALPFSELHLLCLQGMCLSLAWPLKRCDRERALEVSLMSATGLG